MLTIQRRKRIGLVLIVAGPLLAALAFPRLPGQTVLTHGQRLVAFDHWSTTPLSGDLPYQWIPGDRMIMKGDDGAVRIIDVDRKTAVRADAIDTAYRRDPALVAARDGGPSDWVASPDGKWILSWWRIGSRFYWVAGTVDGKHLIKVPAQRGEVLVAWNAESDGWTELWQTGPDDDATRYFLDGRHPTTVDLYPLTPSFAFLRPLGMMGPDRILVYLPPGGAYFNALSVRLDRPGIRPIGIRYQVGLHAWIAEVQLSPDGNRLAWLLDRPVDDSSVRLRRMLPFTSRRNFRMRKEIWVSRLDGSGMRPLAGGDVVGRDELNADQPQFIRWTPDGRSITYLYKDAIWSVQAS